LESAAGGALVRHLVVAGAESAARPNLDRPAIVLQGDEEGFRPLEWLNGDVHG
jgi:hypothetical protein